MTCFRGHGHIHGEEYLGRLVRASEESAAQARILKDALVGELLNPLAALGEHAAEAIDPEQFAGARQSAGIEFDRFRPFVVRDAPGYPAAAGPHHSLRIDLSQ